MTRFREPGTNGFQSKLGPTAFGGGFTFGGGFGAAVIEKG